MNHACELDLDLSHVPSELKVLPRWTLWRYQTRGDAKTKVPIGLRDGQAASITDAENHHPFEVVVAALKQGDVAADGVGFIFVKADGLTGIDLDGCIDEEGNLSGEARAILNELGSYAEISPSGRGIKVIVRGTKPGRSCNKRGVLGMAGVEMYDDKRFFTITGRKWEHAATTIAEAQVALETLYRRVFGEPDKSGSLLNGEATKVASTLEAVEALSDDQVLARARAARSGAKFSELFDEGDTSEYKGDDSRADMALCAYLSQQTRDPAQIDRLFRQSKLMRPKWDESRGTPRTYGSNTIEKLVASVARRGGQETDPLAEEPDIRIPALDGVDLVVRYVDVQAGTVTATVDLVIDGTPTPASVRLSTNRRRRREAASEIIEQIRWTRKDWQDSKADQAAIAAAITNITSLVPAKSLQTSLGSRRNRDACHTERCQAIELLGECLEGRLGPAFKLRESEAAIWCEGPGLLMRRKEFCDQADDELLAHLATVYPWVSAPGGGNARAMTELRAVLRLVWSGLIQKLPSEVGAKNLGVDSKAASEFRRRIIDLCMRADFQWRTADRGGFESVSIAEALVRERESLNTTWRRVLNNASLFTRQAERADGTTEFQVAVSYRVFRVLESKGHRAAWDESNFTKLARRYGVAAADEPTPIVRDGEAAQRCTRLAPEFLKDLLGPLVQPA